MHVNVYEVRFSRESSLFHVEGRDGTDFSEPILIGSSSLKKQGHRYDQS
jgi:hypothetical protein